MLYEKFSLRSDDDFERAILKVHFLNEIDFKLQLGKC